MAGLFLSLVCHAQIIPLDISKVDSCMAQKAKPVLVLLSTDWCKYCQMQKHQIRKNKDFRAKADLFYYVEFNVESKANIRFQGIPYTFKATGVSTGLHELAIALNGEGQLSFPTWVLLDKNYEILFRHGGVLLPQQMKQLLDVIETLEKSNISNP